MWEALNNSRLVSSLIVVDVSPGRGFTGGVDSVGLFLERMVQIGRNWPSKQEVPMNKIRPWLDEKLRDTVPDSTRPFVMTNLSRKGEEYSWKCNVEALSRDIANLRHFPETDNVYQKETLFIGGVDSPYITADRHAEIMRLFPLADIEMVENCGHWVHADQPEIFVELCSDFLLTQP